MCCRWIKRSENYEVQIFKNDEDFLIRSLISKQWHLRDPMIFLFFTLPNYDSSHYLNITVYLAVMLQAPLHTKKFTFQLCYKLLFILQNLTESKKFHKSSHDGLLKNNILGKVSDAISVSTILKNKLYQHKVPVLPICSIYPTLNKVWILLKNGVTFTHFLVSAIKNNSDKPN